MGYYSDHTASMAVGNVNREFSKYKKRTKKLRKLYKDGKFSEEAMEKAYSEFTGIYSHVLDYVFCEGPNFGKTTNASAAKTLSCYIAKQKVCFPK